MCVYNWSNAVICVILLVCMSLSLSISLFFVLHIRYQGLVMRLLDIDVFDRIGRLDELLVEVLKGASVEEYTNKSGCFPVHNIQCTLTPPPQRPAALTRAPWTRDRRTAGWSGAWWWSQCSGDRADGTHRTKRSSVSRSSRCMAFAVPSLSVNTKEYMAFECGYNSKLQYSLGHEQCWQCCENIQKTCHVFLPQFESDSLCVSRSLDLSMYIRIWKIINDKCR